MQYFISDLACIILASTNGLHKHLLFSTKSASLHRIIGDTATERFDWEEKRKEVYTFMSPIRKVAWLRPVPGSSLIGGEDEAKK